ncbi:MAG: FHA domain-containing protein, partial [Desulfobacteraceae bacterium]
MMAMPTISVQLVHIQGPLKGEIQELSDTEILIGRHPDCQVNFPKDLVTLSRIHAKIVREGNRFKLIDQSTNGTYVNGQKVSEVYLKDGDVVMFAEGGPKVSFLTQTRTAQAQPTSPSSEPRENGRPAPPPFSRSTLEAPPVQPPPAGKMAQAALQKPIPPAHAVQPPPSPSSPVVSPETVKVPFAIQYGPALRSFQTLPIVIGNSSACDFPIQNSALIERHAQIFFARNQYWIKDLTGTNSISIDGQPISMQAPLEPDMQIALTRKGPKFRFIGGGRLAEIEDPLPEPPVVPTNPAVQQTKPKPEKVHLSGL